MIFSIPPPPDQACFDYLKMNYVAQPGVTENLLNISVGNNLSDTSFNTILRKTKKIIIEKLGVDSNEVQLKARFTQDLGADSLDIVELIMEFEKEFNILIPDAQAEKIATVKDAIVCIQKSLKATVEK